MTLEHKMLVGFMFGIVIGMINGWRLGKALALHCVVRGAADMTDTEIAHAVWARDRLEKMKPWH